MDRTPGNADIYLIVNPATAMRCTHYLLPALLISQLVQAQNIGINTSGATPAPSAMLDVDATDRGLLVPRVALTATNAAGPVTLPANSLLVYNTATAGTAPNNVTPGYYYYQTATSTWLPILSGVKGWSTTGNAGTSPTTNFIGTTDAQDFVLKTGGSAAANERVRLLSAGPVILNNTTAYSGDVLSVYGTGTTNGATNAIGALGTSVINAYAPGNGIGVYSEVASSGSSNGVGGLFVHSALNTPDNAVSMGVRSLNTAPPLNSASGGISYGVYGDASGTVGSNGGNAIGVFGSAGSSNSATGVVALGGGTNFYTMTTGSGASFTGQSIGSVSIALSTPGGVGAIGISDASNSIITPTRGAGLLGIGNQYGVVGMNQQTLANTNQANNQATTLNNNAGGYFEMQNNGGTAQAWTYVATRVGGTLYKVHGSGAQGTIVKDLDGSYIGLACPESPEIVFQDYGSSQLVDGRAHVEIDPRFVAHITVNDKHPLRVFIQLEGACNGVYVTNKTATSFDVLELLGGSSDAAFSYTIIANRADEVLPDGSTASYADVRFPPAPGPAERSELKALRQTVPGSERLRKAPVEQGSKP